MKWFNKKEVSHCFFCNNSIKEEETFIVELKTSDFGICKYKTCNHCAKQLNEIIDGGEGTTSV